MSIEHKYNKFVSALFSKLPFAGVQDFKDKDSAVLMHTVYMLNRTQSMFTYEGLPETIPQRILELYLQMNGNCCFARVNDELYIFTGGLGGEPDVYYQPTIYTVANPALNFSKNLKIGTDCVVVKNDSMYAGLLPIYNRYASQMAENELTMNIAIINLRIFSLLSAEDDRTYESAVAYLERVRAGDLGVVAETSFLDGLKVQPYGTVGNGNYISQLIEMEQYLKAGWYNDIGLNANYNMKREALSSAESQLNDDALLPLVDDMLRCREEGLEKVNEMFGTDISVKLNSAWEDNQIEIDLEQKQLEEPEEPEEPETDPEEGGDDEKNEAE